MFTRNYLRKHRKTIVDYVLGNQVKKDVITNNSPEETHNLYTGKPSITDRSTDFDVSKHAVAKNLLLNDKTKERIIEFFKLKFIEIGEITKANFSLNSSASSLKECFLVIKSIDDSIYEAQQIVKFNIKIEFNVEFDF